MAKKKKSPKKSAPKKRTASAKKAAPKKAAAKKAAPKKASAKKASAVKTKAMKSAKSMAESFLGQYVILKANVADSGDLFNGRLGLPSAGPMRAPTPPPVEVESAALKAHELADVRRDPQVVSIAPAMPMQLVAPVSVGPVVGPAAPGNTWGVEAVGAHQSLLTGAGITVAVLDTGIDATHPAFAGVNLVQRNFTSEGPADVHGHGTHCAGTIFGRDVGGLRIGVARGVQRALIGKVLGAGGGSSVSIAQAIRWAVDEGANVISMSLGIDFAGYVAFLIGQGFPAELATSKALEGYRTNVRLYDTLAANVRAQGMFGRGCVIVAAAGNESRRQVDPNFEITVAPPATADGIVSVAALGQTAAAGGFMVANFSNTGANVSAPGVNIQSARLGGGLVAMNGTSMATPHVAGVAALWAEQLITATGGALPADQLVAKLVGNAQALPGLDAMDVGAGIVKAP